MFIEHQRFLKSSELIQFYYFPACEEIELTWFFRESEAFLSYRSEPELLRWLDRKLYHFCHAAKIPQPLPFSYEVMGISIATSGKELRKILFHLEMRFESC